MAVTAALTPAVGLAADWRSMTPTEYAAKTTIQSGSTSTHTYFRFDGGEPLTFSVEGPTRVKILTRVRMANDLDETEYAVSVSRDGVHVSTEEFTVGPSASAFYVSLNGCRPGALRRIYIDVPTGTHGYVLRAAGRTAVDARVFLRATPEPSRVSIAPRSYESVETLLYREKELTYYFLTKDRPVVLEVVGPTTLKVNTRLLFDETMLADQRYVIGVREPGMPECLYKVEGVPSQTVVCRDRSDVVPGALRHFMIEVGNGPHTFEFRLVDTVAEAVAVKFYIPRGDLLNGS
jgi:hypothetical protein